MCYTSRALTLKMKRSRIEKINIMGHVSKSGGAFSRKKRKVENKGNRDASSHHKLNCPAVPVTHVKLPHQTLNIGFGESTAIAFIGLSLMLLLALKQKLRHQTEFLGNLQTITFMYSCFSKINPLQIPQKFKLIP
jgi:hypothetical protein